MLKKIRVVIALSLALSNLSYSIEPEPNWKTRYAAYKQEAIASFKDPSIGDSITLERRIGGEITGRITDLTAGTIKVDDKVFKAAQLTPACCEKVFPDISSVKTASERIKTEQANYQARKAEELRIQKQAAAKLEAERIAAEELAAAKLQAEVKAKQAAAVREQKQAQAQEAAENRAAILAEQQHNLAKEERFMRKLGVGLIVLLIVGFLIYIIPSFIAFARGHSNAVAICVLNILLGWTFLGWVISLVWSFTSQDSDSRRR